MNIFQHLEKIDEYIKDVKEETIRESQFTNIISNLGIGITNSSSSEQMNSQSNS